jgi:hypothetical protein
MHSFSDPALLDRISEAEAKTFKFEPIHVCLGFIHVAPDPLDQYLYSFQYQ